MYNDFVSHEPSVGHDSPVMRDQGGGCNARDVSAPAGTCGVGGLSGAPGTFEWAVCRCLPLASEEKHTGDVCVVRDGTRGARGNGQARFCDGLSAGEVDAALHEAAREYEEAEGNTLLWFYEMDSRRLYADFDYPTMKEYAVNRLGFTKNRAARFARLSRCLRSLPRLRRVMAKKELEWTKIEVLVRVATRESERNWIRRAANTGRRELRRQVAQAMKRGNLRAKSGAVQGVLGSESMAAQQDDHKEGEIQSGEVHGDTFPNSAPLVSQGKQNARCPGRGTGQASNETSGGNDSRGESSGHDTEGTPGEQGGSGERGESGEDGGLGKKEIESPIVVDTAGLRPLAEIPMTDADEEIPDAPVTLRLRFSSLEFARYEAIREKLHKARIVPTACSMAEMVLDALDALLEAGEAEAAVRDGKRNASSMETPPDPASARRTSGASDTDGTPRAAAVGGASRNVAVGGASGSPVARGVPGDCPHSKRSDADAKSTFGSTSGAFDNPADIDRTGFRHRRPTPYQIIIYACDLCRKSHVQTGQGPRALSRAEYDMASCDAVIVESGQRKRSTIPPSTRSAVFERDGHQCRVRGCGRTRYLEVHHLVPRSKGGSNRRDNLVTLCSRCHRHWHEKGWDSRVLRPVNGDPADP